MKKTIAVILAILMCVTVFAGCGGSDTPPARNLDSEAVPAAQDTGPSGYYTVVSMVSEGEEVLALFNSMGSDTSDWHIEFRRGGVCMMYISFVDEGVYLEGTYALSGDNITVTFSEADLEMAGTVDGNRITLDMDGVDIVYEKNNSFTFDPTGVPVPFRAPWDDPNLPTLPYGEHLFTEETFFRFVPNQHGTWEFSTSGSGDSDPVVTIYNENGNQIAHDDDGGIGYDAYLLVDLAESVIVGVTFWGTPTTTKLSISFSGGISGNGGTTSVDGETEFYFTPAQTAIWELRTFDNGSYDPVLYLYDSNGNRITTDDDSGDGRNALIIIELEEGLTYRIRAAFFGSSAGTYTLAVTLAPHLPTAGGTVHVSSSTGYAFTPNQSGTWVFETTNNGDSDPKLYLYDSSGRLITSDDDGGEGYNALIVIDLDEGESYGIVATYWSASDSGSFDLNVTKR